MKEKTLEFIVECYSIITMQLKNTKNLKYIFGEDSEL